MLSIAPELTTTEVKTEQKPAMFWSVDLREHPPLLHRLPPTTASPTTEGGTPPPRK